LIILHFFSLKITKRKALVFSNFEAIERFTSEKILSKNLILLTMRVLAFLFLILAITGINLNYIGETSDFDFILAIDSSGSMLATDYEPNRLEAAKNAALEFVDYIPSNIKVGVVSFAGAGFIKTKPTLDHSEVKKTIKDLNIELTGGTAIGDAIVTSTNLLMIEDKPKVIVLLTDGQNNIGITLDEAINYANFNNILINTIGIGTKEGGYFTNYNESVVSVIDEESLKKIAEKTNGKYYWAENSEKLKEAYKEIADTKEKRISLNLSLYLMLIGILILIIEFTLMNTKYRTIP